MSAPSALPDEIASPGLAPARRTLWLALPAALVAVVVIRAFVSPEPSGDTFALVAGAEHARGCLADGVFSSCGPEVVHFPLFQYVPALLLLVGGLSASEVVTVLSGVSTVGFVLILLLGAHLVRRFGNPGRAAWLLLALLSGPLVWYAASSFGEMLAALLTLGLVAAVAHRLPWPVIALAFACAGVTKEVAPPFLILLGVATLVATRADRRNRGVVIGLGVGFALAVAANLLFNVFRFGSPRNVLSLDPLFRVPGTGNRASFLAAEWASPSGGLLVGWPIAGALLVAAALAAIAALRGSGPLRSRATDAAPFALAVAIVVGLTVGFSLWVAPLGWIAWGHRFLIPWLPALLVVVVMARSSFFDRLLGVIARRPLLLAVVGVGALFGALTTLGAMVDAPAIFQTFFFEPTPECPRPVYIQDGADYYYRCTRFFLWDKHPMTLSALERLDQPGTLALAALWSAAIGSMLMTIRAYSMRRT